MSNPEYIELSADDPLLTPDEMANAINVSVSHLANLRSQGRGPDFIRLGDGPRAAVRYPRRQRIAPAK